MSGIYIHIPYCRQACHYCSFHFSTSIKNKATLVSSLIKEIELRHKELSQSTLDSIYLGGGTPSLLTDEELASIMKKIGSYWQIDGSTEITLEANPEDITKEKLTSWHSIGVNRLSIGIQSFHEDDLKYMNRAHNADQSHHALSLINSSPFKAVSADLMFGLIDRSLDDWAANLDIMLSYDLDHLSIYNLTVEEQTVFANWKLKNKLQESTSELQYEQYMLAEQKLSASGYDHYEISNYAKPKRQAIHNTNYWNRKPYLGIGPSAHSYIDGRRSWNVANNATYIKQLESNSYTPSTEHITEVDRYNELIMLGLRTKNGVKKSDLNQLSDRLQLHFYKTLEPKIKKNIIIANESHYRLDPDHWYVSDSISSELFFVD